MLNKPTVLSSGEWMLPISLDQRPGFRQFKGCFQELAPCAARHARSHTLLRPA